MATFRDRIVELRRVKASDLIVNPKNWRLHPEGQRSALAEMLASIGYVGAGIARDTPKGVELLDGHLRKDLTGHDELPVLIVDLDDDEADKMLATYDPLGGLALVDSDKLGNLLDGITLDENADLKRMLTDLMTKLEKDEEDNEDEREVVGMALQPHEHYDFLVVLASTVQEWNVLCDKLGLVPEQRRGRMGTSRAMRATVLIEKLK